MIPMSSTGGGGGGGGGGAGFADFAGFLAVVAAGLGFGFELLVAGFGTVEAGLVAAGVCANETDASAHAATRAAASFKARGSKASMGAILRGHTAWRSRPQQTSSAYQRVSTARRSVRGSTG